MAYQSLYRRYRSQKFSELRGQSHVTSALKTAVAEGRYGHAYLFSGPRGTGKTSTARILAKALNCENVTDGEPCGECESCVSIELGKSFDLYELDAASHNKVDDVRDLISKVHLGSPGRTKVYILDEVHMLSSGAENALLKTLEEPPDHVVFVLATTEPHKVVPTIRSRTQHFEFHLLPAEELVDHVKYIIEDAGLAVDDAAIDYVLTQGGGSARDTLSALDLVAAAGGVPAGSDVGVMLAKAIGAASAEGAIAAVQDGLTTGQEPRIIGEATVEVLRNAFLASMGASLDHLSDRVQATATELAGELGAATLTRSLEAIGQALVEMRQAPDPRVPLEVCLLKLCNNGPAAPPAAPPAPGDGQPPAAPADPNLAAKVQSLEQQVAALQNELRALQAGGATAAPSPAATTPAASSGDAPAPAAETAPAPSGPAAAARERLSEITAKAPPSPRAKRRGQDRPAPDGGEAKEQPPAASAQEQPPAAVAETPAPPAQDPAAAGGSEPTAPQAETPTSAPAPTSADPTDPASPQPAAPQAGEPEQNQPATPDQGAQQPQGDRPVLSSALTLASVTSAFDEQLDGVRQKVRVRFKSGRVLAVEGNTITFGVTTPIHKDRCNEVKEEIEGAFSSHFGHPVALEVVVDDDAPSPNMDPAKIETRHTVEITADEDVGPVEELQNATDQSANGLERLTKAFPGSTVVEPDPNQEKP